MLAISKPVGMLIKTPETTIRKMQKRGKKMTRSKKKNVGGKGGLEARRSNTSDQKHSEHSVSRGTYPFKF